MAASLLLCTNLWPKLSSTSNNFVELLKSSLSLALLTVANFNTLYPNEEHVNKGEQVTLVLGNLESILNKWISDRRVIGGSMFGASSYSRSTQAETEIRVLYHFNNMSLIILVLILFCRYGIPYFSWNAHEMLKLLTGGRILCGALSRNE